MNYKEQKISCCYNCKYHSEEADGHLTMWCHRNELHADYVDVLGICNIYEGE